MLTRIVLGLVLLALGGCAHSYGLIPIEEKEAESFHVRSTTRSFVVHLKDGSVIRGRDLVVGAGSLTWTTASTADPSEVHLAQVDYVEFTDRVSGGVEGFMYGFLVGGIGGAAIAHGSGPSTPVAGAAILGVSTGLIGALLGVVGGTRDRYYPSNKALQLPAGDVGW